MHDLQLHARGRPLLSDQQYRPNKRPNASNPNRRTQHLPLQLRPKHASSMSPAVQRQVNSAMMQATMPVQ